MKWGRSNPSLSFLKHCKKVGDKEHIAAIYLLRMLRNASENKKKKESYNLTREVFLKNFAINVAPRYVGLNNSTTQMEVKM